MPNALGWRLGRSNDTPLPGTKSSALGRGRQPVRLLRAHRERPRSNRTAEHVLNSPRLMGAYPKAKEHELDYSTVHRSKKWALMSQLGQ